MTLRDDLKRLTPRLRRYARALSTGHAAPCPRADDLVHSTLMRALNARSVGPSEDLCIRLYATVTQLHREAGFFATSALVATGGRPSLVSAETEMPYMGQRTRLSMALMGLPLEEREALLLVTLEGFDYGQVARILRISRGVLLGRLTRARTALEGHLQTRPPHLRAPRSTSHLRLVT